MPFFKNIKKVNVNLDKKSQNTHILDVKSAGDNDQENAHSVVSSSTINPLNFDHLPVVLSVRDDMRQKCNLATGEIYFSESIDDIQNALRLIKSEETESCKIGVLYRAHGHTTAILIYKHVPEDIDQEETMYIINIDSTVFSIDSSDSLKQELEVLSEHADVYSLGYHDPELTIQLNYKRQHDHHSCATVALLDLEQLLKTDLLGFIQHNSIPVHGCENMFTLCKLPPSLMYTMQSIYGKESGGVAERKGLKHYVSENPVDADTPIVLFDSILVPSVVSKHPAVSKFVQEMISNMSLDKVLSYESKAQNDESNYVASYNSDKSNMLLTHTTTLKKFYLWLNQKKLQNQVVDIYNCYYFSIYKDHFDFSLDVSTHALNVNNLTADAVFKIADRQSYEISKRQNVKSSSYDGNNNDHSVSQRYGVKNTLLIFGYLMFMTFMATKAVCGDSYNKNRNIDPKFYKARNKFDDEISGENEFNNSDNTSMRYSKKSL